MHKLSYPDSMAESDAEMLLAFPALVRDFPFCTEFSFSFFSFSVYACTLLFGVSTVKTVAQPFESVAVGMQHKIPQQQKHP
jgi:hypothetical protein